MRKKIFIAVPYSGTEEEKQIRMSKLLNYAIDIFNSGNAYISPLILGLALAEHGKLKTDTETWKTFSEVLLKGCDEMHVLMLDGYEKSTGIKYELAEADKFGIKIVYISKNDLR